MNCVFYSGRIRTLVAMATSVFHRLIFGKVNIDNIFWFNGRYLEVIFTEIFSQSRFIWHLSKLLNVIGFQGDKKGKF